MALHRNSLFPQLLHRGERLEPDGHRPDFIGGTFSIRSTNRWINTLWVVE